MATLMRCTARIVIPRITPIFHKSAVFCKSPQNVRTFARVAALLSERKYSDKHEWVSVKGDIGTIGISDYAQEALGDIVYVQLPDVDTEFDIEDECGTLESVKAASELYSPLTGTVTEKNEKAEETPGIINKSCYDQGWLFKMKMHNQSELDDLMTEEQYEQFLLDEK